MKFIIILLPIMGVACETCTRLKPQEHTNRYESGQRLERIDINTIREVSSAYQNAHGRVDMQENPFGDVNASKRTDPAGNVLAKVTYKVLFHGQNTTFQLTSNGEVDDVIDKCKEVKKTPENLALFAKVQR
ncbi:unnamed protein product [Nippostrongylus brasiliensis]|uniref:Cystatin domain-containing protein n=1 Tax=Nippostrongylus brasiliensis TaxID=27835 RepID=A0A0N4YPE3_NIPBR|nr:unnamed protein product [Nippostrongylus brasiliensis]